MREKVELFFIVSFVLIFGLDAKIRNLEIVSISLIEDALVGEFLALELGWLFFIDLTT